MSTSIDPSGRTIVACSGPRPDFQTGLVLLNYLINASDSDLTGRRVTERELDGGALFFNGPHALRRGPVLKRFGRDAQGMVAAARLMGGVAVPGGDGAFRLLVLPKVMTVYTLYEGDDEFDAALTVTFDSSADRHLPLDSIWAMINLLTGRLAE